MVSKSRHQTWQFLWNGTISSMMYMMDCTVTVLPTKRSGVLMSVIHKLISPWTKRAAILQTIFSDAFSWMKNFVFWLKVHWSLLPGVQFTIYLGIGLNNSLTPNRRQAIIWINADPIHWCICGTWGRWVNNNRIKNVCEWQIIPVSAYNVNQLKSHFKAVLQRHDTNTWLQEINSRDQNPICITYAMFSIL